MFAAGLLQRSQTLYLNYAIPLIPIDYDPIDFIRNGKNNLPNLFLLGGGLGKLQGGIKEEEYFSSVNQGLMTNIRKHIENSKNADYMRNWEEYQKTLDHAALYNTTCINKHKDLHEEAFFMNESTECLKVLNAKVNAATDEELVGGEPAGNDNNAKDFKSNLDS